MLTNCVHETARQEKKLAINQIKTLSAQHTKKAEAAVVEDQKNKLNLFLSLPPSAW
jgi:hypothetical protein